MGSDSVWESVRARTGNCTILAIDTPNVLFGMGTRFTEVGVNRELNALITSNYSILRGKKSMYKPSCVV